MCGRPTSFLCPLLLKTANPTFHACLLLYSQQTANQLCVCVCVCVLRPETADGLWVYVLLLYSQQPANQSSVCALLSMANNLLISINQCPLGLRPPNGLLYRFCFYTVSNLPTSALCELKFCFCTVSNLPTSFLCEFAWMRAGSCRRRDSPPPEERHR